MACTQSSASSAPAPSSSKCNECNTTLASPKRCAKCKTATYCDRSCQTAHWRTHKKECAMLANAHHAGDQSLPGEPPKRTDDKPFAAIYHNNFPHDRSEKETFKILIDLIRMRQEDVYNLDGDTMEGTIYDQEPTSEPAFRKFLDKAKATAGFLPPWWTDKKTEECVAFGLRSSSFSLECAQEKSDIQKEWGDHHMPMKLRMLGEKVYGNTPGGSRSEGMLARQMSLESGTLGQHTVDIDLAGSFRDWKATL
ncbi:hypothetical protein LTS10_010551 [Elasticomyces elasticus]|nr:hypothetical protein LTS10_010551 [Elasticomyces elasticus]